MPFYTFKCRTCSLEKEEMRTINDFKEPLCPTCSYNPEIQGKKERMEKIIPKVGGRPILKGEGFYENDYVKTKDKIAFYDNKAKVKEASKVFDSEYGMFYDKKTGEEKPLHFKNDMDRIYEEQKQETKILHQKHSGKKHTPKKKKKRKKK
tara:strand:+ start:32 stop:481 length:450 start_codon:yes stop_codon:yes gene_type:complete